MNCTNSKKFIDAYMDGELEAGMMLEIETHLDNCANCAGLFQVKKKMQSELSMLGRIQAPEHLRAQVESIHNGKFRLWWKRPMVAAPLAAAAALMLLFWSSGNEQLPISTQEVALMVDDVVDRHIRELPMEIQNSSQNAAASWFQGKIDFPVRTLGPGIKNATFKGARVSNVREHQAAQMVYLVDGKKVTFMVFPANRLSVSGGNLMTVKGKKIVTGQRNGYNVVMAKEGDMIYALSSDLPVKRLVSLLVDSDFNQAY